MRLPTVLLTLGLCAVSCSSGGGPAAASQTPSAPLSSSHDSPSSEASPSQNSGSGLPVVRLTPSSGPTGTRVRMAGTGFVEPRWPYGSGRQTTIILELMGVGGPEGCALVAEPIGRARVDPDGRLTGSFVVPSRGVCRQDVHEPPRQPRLVAGSYVLSLACTACFVGSFRVTEA